MIPLTITLNLDLDPWHDLAEHRPAHGVIERIGLLPNGTAKGRPTIALLIRLDDGRTIDAETTWALLRAAMTALNASPVAELDRMEHPNG